MKRIKTLVAGVAIVVTTGVVSLGMSQAHGAGAVPDNGDYSVSNDTVSQSMVAGSSPTSLGNSRLARTPAGKAAAAAAAADPSGDYTESSALVQYETPAGKVIGHKRYGPKSMGKVLPAFQKKAGGRLSAHAGGDSSASGCIRVTVTQTRKGALGDVHWKFHVWTDWCWTRGNQVVDVNGHNWYISDVDSQFQWKEIIKTTANYYDFSANDGHPRSAYYHYRMGHLTNCVFKFGCIGDYYPVNYLRSYYNGTWVWDTDL